MVQTLLSPHSIPTWGHVLVSIPHWVYGADPPPSPTKDMYHWVSLTEYMAHILLSSPIPTGDMCYWVSPTEYMAELLLSSPFPTGDMYHLYPLTNVHTNCQITSYKLWLLRYSPDKMLKVKVTTVRSKSRSHHDVAHIHPPNQCPYKISTSYTVWFLRHSCGVGDRAVG